MRIYVPATSQDLSSDAGVPGRRGHGLTSELVAALAEADPEEVEYHAYLLTVEDCLEALRAAQAQPPRVVVAADVPDAAVATDPHSRQVDPSAITVTGPVAWDDVIAIFVDDPAADHLVRQALDGDEVAAAALDDWDLMWYDPKERHDLANQRA